MILGRGAATLPPFELWNEAGIPLERSPALGDLHLDAHAPRGRVVAIALPAGRGRQATVEFAPRQDEEEPAAPPKHFVLGVARDTAGVEASLATLRAVLIAVGLAATLACVLVLVWVTHRGLAPLRSLAHAITKLDEHALATRLSGLEAPAELQVVVARLDDLLARLEAAFARERELTAEVAHELRTPLAGLRSTIEVALDRERDGAAYRTALASCLSICDQTQRTVEVLLSLARLDAGTLAATPGPVDVAALAGEVAAGYIARAAERSLELAIDLHPTTARADADQLRIVLANLLDNAVSYADPGTAVRVEIEASALRVSNQTELADASHVFDRFWRADGARTAGHVGLGLALSRKLVEVGGGTLTAELVGGRFVATVALPA